MRISTCTRPMPSATDISERSDPWGCSALATRSRSRRPTGAPSKRSSPAIPLTPGAASCWLRAELRQTRDAGGIGRSDDDLAAALDPGLRREPRAVPGDTEAEPACNPAPAQHGLRGKSASELVPAHPAPAGQRFDGPSDPRDLGR